MIKLEWRFADQCLIIGLAVVFILGQIWSHSFFTWLLGALVVLAVIVILPRLRGPILIMISTFLITGAALLWAQGANALTWIESATMNVNLVTLLIFAPLFGIPVRFPEYIRGLAGLYKHKINRKVPFFLGTQLLNHLVAIVMNIGSISVVYQIASVNQALRSNRLIANALSRGFGFSILWSPYFAAMVLVTSGLDIEWITMFPYLIGFTLICFLISFLLEWPYLHETDPNRFASDKQQEDDQEFQIVSEPKYGKPLMRLTLYLGSAIVLIMLLDNMMEWSIIMTICLTGVIYPLLWCVIHRAFSVYKEGIGKHLNVSVPSLKREVILFISAGFLSGAVALTSFDMWLYQLLDAAPLPIPLMFTLLVLVAFFVTSLMGLHPIVLAAILVTGIDPQMMGVSTMYYAVLVLGGWASTIMMSPSTAANNLLAYLLNINVFEIARKNYTLGVILLFVLAFYLLII